MRRINSMYARYFNSKYQCIGHLFQGRYFSNLINNVIELLEVSRYIHLIQSELKWLVVQKIICGLAIIRLY